MEMYYIKIIVVYGHIPLIFDQWICDYGYLALGAQVMLFSKPGSLWSYIFLKKKKQKSQPQ